MNSKFEFLSQQLLAACRTYYGTRLVSLVIFGSVGRGTARPDSDIDFLIVVEKLPKGRLPRVTEFQAVEKLLVPHLVQAQAEGLAAELSPIFKTPSEVQLGSPLFLDMLDDGRILYDRDNFIRQAFDEFRKRLKKLGAKRIWRGDSWYWDLKPDYKPGEVFEL